MVRLAAPLVRRWLGGKRLPADARWIEGASKLVQPEDVAEQIPCSPDFDAVVEAVKPFWEAGFTDIAIVQVGDEGQSAFLDQAAMPLLQKLRAAAG